MLPGLRSAVQGPPASEAIRGRLCARLGGRSREWGARGKHVSCGCSVPAAPSSPHSRPIPGQAFPRWRNPLGHGGGTGARPAGRPPPGPRASAPARGPLLLGGGGSPLPEDWPEQESGSGWVDPGSPPGRRPASGVVRNCSKGRTFSVSTRGRGPSVRNGRAVRVSLLKSVRSCPSWVKNFGSHLTENKGNSTFHSHLEPPIPSPTACSPTFLLFPLLQPYWLPWGSSNIQALSQGLCTCWSALSPQNSQGSLTVSDSIQVLSS